MAKGKGGFIGQDGLNAPDAPTGVSGTAGDTEVDVSFTSPSDVGGSAITEYLVTDSTKTHTATGSSSPVTVTGLTNGTSYTFNVWAINAFGWSVASDASDGVSPVAAPRALFGGEGEINYMQVNTTGNATDFGDLHSGLGQGGSGSSTTRACFYGWSDNIFRIDTVEISTTGNATDFGDSTVARRYNAGLSNSTRAIWAMGNTNSSTTYSNVMDYVTIASTGNATDFGDTLSGQYDGGSGCGSPTRGMIGGGQFNNAISSSTNQIQYITIASTGNGTDFGDLTQARRTPAALSSDTRAVWGGGRTTSNADTNVMDYVTIATTGNASDFGDLGTGSYAQNEGSGSNVRGLWGPSLLYTSTIHYITIGTTGNSVDFGDLITNTYTAMVCSNAHGGLQ